MDAFETFPEQAEAKRLLRAALDEGPAHAYLFHGPPGVGKRRAALAFAGELIGDRARVERRAHSDVYLVEPVGDQIRIDDIRELRRDLHMRPFEADRRVYLVFGAHLPPLTQWLAQFGAPSAKPAESTETGASGTSWQAPEPAVPTLWVPYVSVGDCDATLARATGRRVLRASTIPAAPASSRNKWSMNSK